MYERVRQERDDLLSISEAAKLLKVSEATVWRWLGQDIVHGYRVGPKRVFLRKSEVEVISAGSPRKEVADMDVIRDARALQKMILARRGGERLPAAWQDINAAREERSSSA